MAALKQDLASKQIVENSELEGELDTASIFRHLIEGTLMKVVELITSVQAYGSSPEELHFQYPQRLN